jgi:hypothetical protein
VSLFNSIGTDTEIFAQNREGKFISLCGKVGGTKQEPAQIQGWSKGFSLQEDNVSLEFNIPPSKELFEWESSLAIITDYVNREVFLPMGLTASKKASAEFSFDQLQHPQALIFGCEPDFNAWTGEVNESPFCTNPQLRTAGGHIHVGTGRNMVEAIQLMDLFLGVPSVILDDNPSSITRKNLYGKAGAMRPKSYGLEYRVMSNYWIWSPELIRWVFIATTSAMHSTVRLKKKLSSDIQKCINGNDRKLALELIDMYTLPMPDNYVHPQ